MPRALHPRLKAWFDAKLVPTVGPVPPPFCLPHDPVKMFLLTALACVEITEVGADNCGEMVELFQSTIGRAEREPWCMAFVQSCVAYTESFGFKTGLFPSEHCLTVWTNSTSMHSVEPKAGDIVIYQLGETTKGHTEIITAVHARSFDTVAGNTSPATGVIERNGDGVYTKTRPRGGMAKMKELGFIRVFDAPAG